MRAVQPCLTDEEREGRCRWAGVGHLGQLQGAFVLFGALGVCEGQGLEPWNQRVPRCPEVSKRPGV